MMAPRVAPKVAPRKMWHRDPKCFGRWGDYSNIHCFCNLPNVEKFGCFAKTFKLESIPRCGTNVVEMSYTHQMMSLALYFTSHVALL